MDFAAAVRFLQTTTDESKSRRHPGRLDRMRELLALLGNPERRFRSIHVGGTSGKGSTATMAAAMLHAAGFKVGLHTKPHLRSVTERACIDGVAISEERFAKIIESMVPAVDEMKNGEHGPPSYFELLVALAFTLFAEERVDVAVVEVGIGGRLDGTNVLSPLVSVVTNVGMDHTDVLGGTVEEIAADKSGIIKPGIPCVTAAEHPGALRVIEEAAEACGAPLTRVQSVASIGSETHGAYEQRVDVKTERGAYEFTMPLLGEFQVLNAATAIVALERIAGALPVAPADVARAMSTIALPGRMEFYPSRPSLLFDVAHNAEKAEALRAGLVRHFHGKRYAFVVAVAEGKAAREMLAAWSTLPANFIFTTFEVAHLTSMVPHRLAITAEAAGVSARAIDDPVEALGVARRMAAADDLVVITGSTFIVARLREWFARNVAGGSHARA
jgi:dihydrofolate synthase / folylpolyglutamate synthase